MLWVLAVFMIHSSPFDELAEGPKVEDKQEFSYKNGKTFLPKEIQFSGNKAISTKQLKNLTVEYLNQPISETDQKEIQERIELLYRTRGYEKVTVSVTPQEKTGILLISITEGKKTKS